MKVRKSKLFPLKKGSYAQNNGGFTLTHIRSFLALLPGRPLFEDLGVPCTQGPQKGIDMARQADGDPDLPMGQAYGVRPGGHKDHKMPIILRLDQEVAASILDQVAMVHQGDAQKDRYKTDPIGDELRGKFLQAADPALQDGADRSLRGNCQ